MAHTNTLTLTLDDQDEAVLLYGPRDQYLKLIRDALAVRLIARGDKVHIAGPPEQVEQADRAFQELRHMLQQQGRLSAEDVRTVLAVVQRGAERSGPQTLTVVEGGRHVRPRTDGQARYVHAMRENDLILCIGPAGTGKCVAAGTLVLTENGLLPIEELALNTAPGEYQERQILVFGLDGPTRTSHVYNGGISPTVQIRTRHGFELEGTPEHPVLSISDQGIPQWVQLGDLQPGQFVALARDTNLF